MNSIISTSKPMRIVRNTANNKIEFVAVYITSTDGEHTLENQLFEIDGSELSHILNTEGTEVDQAKLLAHLSKPLFNAMEAYKQGFEKKSDKVKETVVVDKPTHKLEV